MTKLLWQPSEDRIKKANMTKFIIKVNSNHNLDLQDYRDLYQWSIHHIDEFWKEVASFVQIKFSNKPSEIVKNIESFPPLTKWFLDAKLNFAENLLKHNDDGLAIISKREDGFRVSLTHHELYTKVAQLASSLRKLGVVPGDRIVGYMPNIPETIISMLAATSIGAIWSSCGAELGATAALDRLGQVEPKVLISVDAYLYKGKEFDQLNKVESVANPISTLEKVIILPYLNAHPDIGAIQNSILYNDFIDAKKVTIEFEQLPFDHPLYIMFSSGTTGKPKCLVQSAGGILINHLKELVLHTDLKHEDRLFYISSPSWMMWNWMTSGLAVGATLVLFDGNPLYPSWRTVWKLIDEEKVNIFGCSASYLHYLKSISAFPRREFTLDSLTQISQTGSALSHEGVDYVYSEIKKDLHFNSISGGTDINGCFAAGSPTLPVYSGQLQAVALGMKVVSYDMDANIVYDEQGELICELPSPSMPIYFWNDKNNERYHDAYFGYYNDRVVWRHGDYIKINSQTRGVTFYGRSDSVLKPSGVRIGTAEIYNVVEDMDEISDSLAIGQQWNNDQRIILFVQLSNDVKYDIDLEKKIKDNLRSKASPRHVPSKIIVAPDIPYTFSGKKVESSITNIIHNKPISNKGALRNPECLEFYENLGDKIKN